MKRVAHRHTDWLSLIEPSGSFVTVPVLNRVFPNGVDRLDPSTRDEMRQHLPTDFHDATAVATWIEWVLRDLLRWGSGFRSGPAVPATLSSTVGEHATVLRPDYVLVDGSGADAHARVLVCVYPPATILTARLAGDRWSASPAERTTLLCRAAGVPVALVTNGDQWHVIWAPRDEPHGTATFTSSLFSEEPALPDAFTSLLGAKRFYAVAPGDTLEGLLTESAAAQEVVAEQLGKQVRAAAELLVDAISRSNREQDGQLLAALPASYVYEAIVTVLMRLVFLLFAEERGLLPLDDDLYAQSYAISTLRDSLQNERDQLGDEPLERRCSAWGRILALFRAVHGGLSHENLRLPPYGGRLFDPDRFPFLEGRTPAEPWRTSAANPIRVDDLTVLALLTGLQVLEFSVGGVREARRLSYRTLEVEQIGHVYEGLLDHSIRVVNAPVVGLIGPTGDEPEILLQDLEAAAAGGRAALVQWLANLTGKTTKQLTKILDTKPGENDRQLLAAAVENDEALVTRIFPYINLLRRDIRDLPVVLLGGSVFITQTTAKREGGIEYTTRDLADEIAEHTLEPLVYSPGPQDTGDRSQWRLRTSNELLDLKICDPAVGSGAILVAAGRYLADRLVEAWTTEGADQASGDPEEVRITGRRAVCDRCLYGVDRDPLAAEMAKLSLWLTTMAKDRPFSFLDHAIRVGDSLLGITDMDQVRWLHLDSSAGRKLHTSLFDYAGLLEPLVKQALVARQRVANIRVITLRDVEDKARLSREADSLLGTLHVIADAIIGAALASSTGSQRVLDDRLRALAPRVAGVLDEHSDVDVLASRLQSLREQAMQWLDVGRPQASPKRICLHWPIEFPEVFLDRDHPGFDAMVGNPPFIGGTKISGAVGTDVREYLVRHIAGGSKGKADLVAYFFLRAISLTSHFGLLATNTIAQGDSSEVGLSQMIDHGWTIYRAAPSTKWPGRASLEIAKIWAARDRWNGPIVLDTREVPGIDEMLYSRPRSNWRKHRLAANDARSFRGSSVLGLGFTMTPGEARALIAKDQKHADVLFPYLGGEDLNNSPTQSAPRWVINFFDWPEERARRYEDCWAWIEERVKPERMEKDRSKYPKMVDMWWRYWNERVDMYRTITPLPRVLGVAQVSSTLMPLFVQTSQVLSEQVIVLAYDDDFHFGVFSSGFHFRWAIRFASTMRTDTRYTPTDVFETFPQPKLNERVAAAGKTLNEHRSILMIAADEGLTATYNHVHDVTDTTPSIVKLRELHVALDLAVRDAYGWSDLDLGHGFHQVRGQGIRYTFSPEVADEILERLLELNKARYEAEVAAGLHGMAKKAPAKRTKTKKNEPDGVLSLFGSEPENGMNEL